MWRSVFLALSLLLSQNLWADVYSFSHPEKTHQLYGYTINAMLEDSEGYLWIGTGSGLYRYDGYDLLSLDKISYLPQGLNVSVSELQEDAQHYLWIRNGGLSDYIVLSPNREFIDVQTYIQQLGFTFDKSSLINVDAKGNLWQINKDALFYYDFINSKCQQFDIPDLEHISSRNISVCADHENFYLLDGCHLWTFSLQYHAWREEVLGLQLPSLGTETESLRFTGGYVDHHGGLWVFSLFSEILLYRNPDSRQWQNIYLPQDINIMQNSIRQVTEDSNGNIWIATDHRGLFVYEPQSGGISHIKHDDNKPEQLLSDNVNCMVIDSHHTIWLGYFRSGISFCQPKQYLPNSHSGLYGNVTALLSDETENLWIGTDGHGLWRRQPDGKEIRLSQIPNYTITDFQKDKDGNLWIGTYDHGIYLLDRQGRICHYDAKKGSLPHDGVQRMVFDAIGRLWVCSAFGDFYCFDPKSESSQIIKGENDGALVGQAVCYDALNNRILLATFYGIWQQDLDANSGKRLLGIGDGAIPFPEYQFENLLCDDFSPLIWMSHQNGLSVWDTQADTLYNLSKTDGLTGVIHAIRQDNEHNIWASTASGLSMISSSRSQNDQWNFYVRNFLAFKGHRGDFFNPYAGTVTTHGEICFGGPNGFINFLPRHILSNETEQIEPLFSSIILGDSILSDRDIIQLGYNDQSLSFSFYTGNPLNASFVRYSYRIKGIQDQWAETANNTLTLLSLSPGKYELELRAAGLSGEWSPVNKVQLKVSPPWWNTTWSWCLYGLALIGIGVLLVLVTRSRQRNKAKTERKQLLQEQQSRLAEMKLQFFTNISHDLRTPLTLIISPLEQLQKEQLPDSVLHRLSIMHKNAKVLLAEISTLLDFRKLDTGAEKLRLGKPCDIVAFIREHGDQYYDVARDCNVRFIQTLPTSPIMTSFDEDKLRKILYNLLSNAFKYSPEGGVVELKVCLEKPNLLKMQVSDQGIGISDSEKQRIFDLFYQAQGGNNPKPGSGIGLYIVQQFVNQFNGRIWVEDNTPTGAVFCLSFPIVVESLLPTDAISNESELLPKEEQDITIEPSKYSILVVDDNEDLCHFIEESLNNEYAVICAYNGTQALSILEKEAVNLVVSDVMMPGISGLELCNCIKSDLRYSHIPVILLTARTAEQSMLEGLQLGADDYLTKPFNVDHLLLRIRKFIEWSQLSHQQFQQQIEIEPHDITITPLDEQFLQKAISVVNENLQNPDFGVESFASAVGMSRSQLYKKLMAVTGKSPLDFIRTMRMKRAYQLLEKSQLQISEIAYQVGYNTLKTFSENFKQEFGQTPSEFKKIH